VIREGSRGFLGMGGEDAIVRVTTRESAETSGPGRPRNPRSGGDRDRDRGEGGESGNRRRGRRGGRSRGGRDGSEQQNDAPRSEDQPRPDHNQSEDRPQRGPRNDRPQRGPQGNSGQRAPQGNSDQRAPQGNSGQRDQRQDRDSAAQRDEPRSQTEEPQAERSDRENRDDRRGGRARSGRGGDRSGGRSDGGRSGGGRGREPRDPSTIHAVDPEEEIQVPGAPSDLPAAIKSDPEDEVDLFGSTLRDLLVILGLSDTSITARDPETPGDGVGLISQVFDVFGENDEVSDELAVLIGRRGETLNALQYLLNVLVSKHTDGELVFSVDIEGYRSRRERTLVDMAHEIAAEVRSTGDVITLEPMPAAERRIIHLSLESEEGVTTESVGRGNDRQVEVMPG
jgi:hypothetical protein